MTPDLRGLYGAGLYKRGRLGGKGLLNKQMRLNDPRFARFWDCGLYKRGHKGCSVPTEIKTGSK